ncbi:hypothetical protein FGW37_22185 [Streptomyces rectiverticillatus]|uniref:hypothetical protein n=1 Tax=Streptomyces rectiverticillatus TaxID=173860 RepID=UPI0015C3D31D|nr:hypothetical protein [Streptomyces rectiverticillatus]QLE73930.1 hypothetical protein FGW37_22185 [Streptomyces rectiverticillatus]
MSPHPAFWLAAGERHPHAVREAWSRGAPAMLRTGLCFDAIRLSAEVVHRRAGGDGRDSVERVFREAGVESAVIVNPARRWYYVLVPPGTAQSWDEPGTEALGLACFLGVPAPGQAEPPGTYWLLRAPTGVEGLCVPAAIRGVAAVLAG